jgi:hypothetical protein
MDPHSVHYRWLYSALLMVALALSLAGCPRRPLPPEGADLVASSPPGSVAFCKEDPNDRRRLVDFRVTNNGSRFAPAFITRVDFFRFGPRDISMAGLRPGEFRDADPITPPQGCFDPDCNFSISVDSQNSVDETNEANNGGAGNCVG